MDIVTDPSLNIVSITPPASEEEVVEDVEEGVSLWKRRPKMKVKTLQMATIVNNLKVHDCLYRPRKYWE